MNNNQPREYAWAVTFSYVERLNFCSEVSIINITSFVVAATQPEAIRSGLDVVIPPVGHLLEAANAIIIPAVICPMNYEVV